MGHDSTGLRVFLPLAYRGELPFLILDVDFKCMSRKPGAAPGCGVGQLVEAILQPRGNSYGYGGRD